MDQNRKKRELARIDALIAQGPFTDTWASLQKWRAPAWFEDAKFGIFVHWGVYSAAAFMNEWYPRNMYIPDTDEFRHHEEVMGPHSAHGYKEYIPLLTGEKFDADAWAELFAQAGARYMVSVAEHHDGFQMYRSRISEWNAAAMGPHRDILGEMAPAARGRGLHFGVSSHRAEHWWFLGNGRRYESDITGEFPEEDLYWPSMAEPADQFDIDAQPWPSEAFLDDWLIRTCELVDRFRPAVLYFDWWIQHLAFRPYLRKAAAYYYNVMAREGMTGIIQYKHEAYAFGCGIPDMERGQFAEAKPFLWQTDTAACRNSWGYTLQNVYKEPEEILCNLADVVSKNGRLLLNVGPKGDGSMTDEETQILRAIGRWMDVNGEAIDASRPYRVSGEGPTQAGEGMFTDNTPPAYTSEDFRFTARGGCVYVIAMKASPDGVYRVKTFGMRGADGSHKYLGRVKAVTLLDGMRKADFEMKEDALEIRVGDAAVNGLPVFRLEVE